MIVMHVILTLVQTQLESSSRLYAVNGRAG